MIPVDIGHVYPKTGIDADIRFDTTPRFVSTGSCFFDGSNDYIDCADHLNSQMASGNFSVVYWAKSTGTAETFVVSKHDGASAYDGYRFGFQGDNYRFRVSDGTTGIEVDGSAIVNDGVWHHFAFSVDRSGNLRAYVDGQLDKETDITSINNAIDPDEDLILGASYSGGSQNFGGNVCNVGIYKGTALDEAQVRSIMAATTYAETAAVVTPSLFYLLDDDYEDSTGNQNGANNGSTLTGDRARIPNGFDLTGNRRDARLHSGRCLSFDGTGDYVDGDSYSDSSDYFSFSLWVEQESSNADRGILTNGPHAADTEHGLLFTTSGGDVRWYFQDGAGTQYVKADTSLRQDIFHHIVVTVDGSDSSSFDVCMYLDGKLQGKTKTSAGFALADKFALGCEHGVGAVGYHWFGSIADVKIFNVELTAAQALELYSNREQILPTGVSASALKRWYPCNDFDVSGANNLEGMFLQDCSGNNKHLEIHNCGMEFSRPDIPQLNLRSSSSRMLIQDDEIVTISSDAAINIFSGADGGGTVAFWIFANSDGESSHGRVLWKSGDYELMTRNESSGTCELQLEVSGFSGGTAIHRSAKSISIGAWTHVVMTYTGLYNANPIFYINGAATTNAADTQTTGTFTDSGDLVLGNKSDGSRSMDGILSEVSLWSSILDADAVTVLYNSGVQGFDPTSDSGDYDVSSDLTAFYRLDNPVTIADLSTNSNTGTVAGTPNMATVPEGTTAGLSTFGAITTETVGSSKINFPFMQDVNSTQLQGYLEHKCPTWGTGEYCVAFWLRTTHLSGGATHYFWDIRGSTNSYGMRIYASATNNILWKPKGAGSGEVAIYPAPSSGTVTDGAWHFVALQRLGATSQKWHWRRITDASFNTGTNSTGFGDMTDAGTAYINGSSSATSPSGGQMAMPRIYIGKSFSDNEIGNMFEQGKRILLGDTL
tara:strand:+ start:178 stop:2994 length:2817 start_codon:yes stop_codon:yes gene_type:complete